MRHYIGKKHGILDKFVKEELALARHTRPELQLQQAKPQQIEIQLWSYLVWYLVSTSPFSNLITVTLTAFRGENSFIFTFSWLYPGCSQWIDLHGWQKRCEGWLDNILVVSNAMLTSHILVMAGPTILLSDRAFTLVGIILINTWQALSVQCTVDSLYRFAQTQHEKA